MKLEVINNSGLPLQRATTGSAGIDLVCNRTLGVDYKRERWQVLVGTGIYTAIPSGYVGLLVPRSSLHKSGWALSNTVGVIDSDYRGEILVKLDWFYPEHPDTIEYGTRIAQLVIVPCPRMEIVEVGKLDETERGAGGFGSTGR